MGSGDTRPAMLHQGTALSDKADGLVTTPAAALLPRLIEFLYPESRRGEQKMNVSLLSYPLSELSPANSDPSFFFK